MVIFSFYFNKKKEFYVLTKHQFVIIQLLKNPTLIKKTDFRKYRIRMKKQLIFNHFMGYFMGIFQGNLNQISAFR